MKLGIYIKLYALMVILFNVSSGLLTTAIISSDTLHIEEHHASDHQDEDAIEFRPPIIIEGSDQPNTIINNNLLADDVQQLEQINEKPIENSDNINEVKLPENELKSEEKYSSEPPSEATEKQFEHKNSDARTGQLSATKKPSVDNEVPNVPVTTPITMDESSKGILIDTPLEESIDNIFNNEQNRSASAEIPQQNADFANIQEPSIETAVATDENEQLKNADNNNLQNESIVNKEHDPGENKTENIESIVEAVPIELNLTTVEENQIPVFSEWAQKRMEEAEKEVEQEVANTSSMKKNMPTVNKAPVLKLKSAKNYASPDCGAKIIAANSESSGTGYVLTSTRDEYLLSPCKSRIWFVVELCEAIQAEHIDLANYELFSSSPKNFSVAVSSRFPTRDWSNVGRFVAKDERYIQSFDLHPHLFGKYVRVDIHSHYNSEHFCPISLFRVYGTSEFEAFETENRQHPIDEIDDVDDDDQEADAVKGKSNIFKSASDAVMSIVDTVKKAASFVKPNDNKTTTNGSDNLNQPYAVHSNCVTPNYVINCENCSQTLTNEVTTLLECKQQLLTRLLSIDVIRNSLYKSQICTELLGTDLNINCRELATNNSSTTSKQLNDLQMNYVTHLFSLKYITAMCNLLAAVDKKIPWNSTYPFSAEASVNITIDKKVGSILTKDHDEKKKVEKREMQTEHSESVTKKSSEENREAGSLDHSNESLNNIPTTDGVENGKNTETVSQNGNSDTILITKPTSNFIPPIDSTGKHESDEEQQQNIFNVAEEQPIDSDSDKSEAQESDSSEKIESIASSTEQTIESDTIILPDVATTIPNGDLNEVTDDPTAVGWNSSPQLGQKLHSESVFLRLANRVKALERNMSLSGQYLEELSRRYKKQVEELQLSFAKTLVNIEEQSRISLERKQELFQQNQKLRDDLEVLTQRVFSWKNIIIFCISFICVQLLIFYVILKIWLRKYLPSPRSKADITSDLINVEANPRRRKSGNVSAKVRRKSAEEKRGHNSSVIALQRRPSTEALNICGTYSELLINDSDSVNNVESDRDCKIFSQNTDKKTRARKNKSTGKREAIAEDFVKIEDLKQMYDKPALNDDYETYGPDAHIQNIEHASDTGDCDSESTLDSSLGGTSPQLKNTKVTNNKFKNRRLSSPSFFKTPFSGGRLSAARATGWEWHRSKKSAKTSQFNNNKKSKSESPEPLKFNGYNNNNSTPSPIALNKSVSERGRNGNDSVRSSVSSSMGSERKQPGSFRRLLKKIF